MTDGASARVPWRGAACGHGVPEPMRTAQGLQLTSGRAVQTLRPDCMDIGCWYGMHRSRSQPCFRATRGASPSSGTLQPCRQRSTPLGYDVQNAPAAQGYSGEVRQTVGKLSGGIQLREPRGDACSWMQEGCIHDVLCRGQTTNRIAVPSC